MKLMYGSMQELRRSKEWKKKSKELRSNTSGCKQCGTEENLVLHHYENPKKPTIKSVAYELFLESKEYEKLPKLKKWCPNCGLKPAVRKTIKPKYRCRQCKGTFKKEELSAERSNGSVMKKGFKDGFNKFKKENANKIRSIFVSRRNNYFKEYLETDKIIVLCKKCHFALHKGMVLCKKCEDKYHRSRFKTCFSCDPKAVRNKLKKRIKKIQKKIRWTQDDIDGLKGPPIDFGFVCSCCGEEFDPNREECKPDEYGYYNFCSDCEGLPNKKELIKKRKEKEKEKRNKELKSLKKHKKKLIKKKKKLKKKLIKKKEQKGD